MNSRVVINHNAAITIKRNSIRWPINILCKNNVILHIDKHLKYN